MAFISRYRCLPHLGHVYLLHGRFWVVTCGNVDQALKLGWLSRCLAVGFDVLHFRIFRLVVVRGDVGRRLGELSTSG